ncbi:uncharacterized protein, partial [Venturia canescens]|uniref:uncharacterized protein n=1 Tax=Venturia canescens TaxID=32260 RepID=UPI001C9C8B4F
ARACFLPAVNVVTKTNSSTSSSNSSSSTVLKDESGDTRSVLLSNNRKLQKSTSVLKLEGKTSTNTSDRVTSCVQTRMASSRIVVSKIGETTNSSSPNLMSKRNDSMNEALKKPHITGNQMNYQTFRGSSTNYVGQESASKFRYSKPKTYQSSETQDETSHRYDYKSNGNGISTSAARYTGQSQSSHHRDNHQIVTSSQQNSRTSGRENLSSLITGNADQRNVQKTTNYQSPGNLQRYVEARYSFVSEERNKHSDCNSSNVKMKTELNSIRNGGVKDLTYSGQSFHGYGSSSIRASMSVQNISNVQPTNITPYVRPDSYASATAVANVLFPDNSQFSQSSTYNHNQVGQLNQYQPYDPSSYSSTPVNSVLTQYSPENTIAYSQYENPPQFVQTNHYPANEITNSQFQFQTGGVGQIQDSPVYLQSLSSPIAEQYAASNYARAVRTELLPRLRAPPRFNK